MPSILSMEMRLVFTLLGICATCGQAPWTGNMHPQIGFPSGCNIDKVNSCAPTYDSLRSAGQLWTCPAGNASKRTCATTAGASACVAGSGGNPTCTNLDADHPCCCPAAGCYTEPLFNWVIGVCRGSGCACGTSTAKSCAPQNQTGRCSASCTGPTVPCCFGADVSPLQPYYTEGSHARINYIGKDLLTLPSCSAIAV